MFDFEIDDVESNYKFSVISSINDELVSTYYSKGTGKAQLEAGQVYTIVVQQYTGLPAYKINIRIVSE